MLCDYCVGKCCRYFALPIERAHDARRLRVYPLVPVARIARRCSRRTANGTCWSTPPCKHLLDDNRCGIYDTRPQICREYSTDACEYDDDFTYERYFETPEQIHEYAEAVLQTPDRISAVRDPHCYPY